MAEWLPTFKVAGGLYAGFTPQGSLDGYFNNLDYVSYHDNMLLDTEQFYWNMNDPGTVSGNRPWSGAFGQGDTAMKHYGDIHLGDGYQTTALMIFDVPIPPGETNYAKQELVVEGKIRGQQELDSYTTARVYDIAITRVYRREYATPYSTPTVTHTFFSDGGSYGLSYNRYVIDGIINGEVVKNFKFATSYYEHDDHNYLCFAFYRLSERLDTKYFTYSAIGFDVTMLNAAFGGNFKLDEEDDPNIPDPDDPGYDPPPGPGPRQPEYDPIEPPGLPELDAVGAGFLTLYSPSKTTLNLLADEIFSSNILDIIKNYFASIQEMIAGLSIVPFFVPVSGFAHHKIGLFKSTVQLPLVRSQFYDLDCGTIDCRRYFNNFLDQSPNTKYMIWLPYCGYQSIDPDEVIGNVLNVRYHCDILSGACVAFLTIGGGGPDADATRVIAQYSGNVLTQVPTASQAYDSLVSNAINILTAGVGIAAGAAIGGSGAAGSGMMAQATAGASQIASAVGAQVGMGIGGTAANMVMSMKPTFSRNGTPGSTAGYMSVQKPYLIKIVPRDAVAPNHIQLKGYPSNYGGTLGSLSGYAEVSEIHLQGVAASVDETTEIYSLLKGGVII